MGIANSFRPIMIILIISIFIYFIFMWLNNKKIFRSLCISFIVITISFISYGKVFNNVASNLINKNVATSASGWTIYIGSNYETNGQWSEDPRFSKFLSNLDFDANKVHQFYFNEGLKRYKENGIRNLNLFIKKAYVLGHGIDEVTISSFNQIVQSHGILSLMLKIILNIYYYMILLLCIIFCKIKGKDDNKTLYLLLLSLGLFTSNLLVEVASRYFTPVMVPMIVISIISLAHILQMKGIKND